MSKVLIVDDEKLIVKGLRFSLEQDELEVECAYDGAEALELVKNNTYDIILLDLMLPKIEGYEVCRLIREFSDVPIIMLTAKADDADKIQGLECGADDYITKPFNVLEVKARIKAILRRVEKQSAKSKIIESKDSEIGSMLLHGDIRLDMSGRRAYIDNKEVNLTAREIELLELFVQNPNKVFTRDRLLTLIWGNDYPGDARTVDVHIRRLREKIEPNPGDPVYVRTKWGVGYYLA